MSVNPLWKEALGAFHMSVRLIFSGAAHTYGVF